MAVDVMRKSVFPYLEEVSLSLPVMLAIWVASDLVQAKLEEAQETPKGTHTVDSCKVKYVPNNFVSLYSRLSTEVNRKCHKFQPSFGGAKWREPEGWSCIPL